MGRLEQAWSIFSCANCIHGYKRNSAFGNLQCRVNNCEHWFITRSSRVCDKYEPDNTCPVQAREMFLIFQRISGGKHEKLSGTARSIRIEKA